MQTKKMFLLPGLALTGGALGFCLRRIQVSRAYNPEMEFFVKGHPSTFLLLGVLALVLVLLALLVRGGRTPEDFLPLMRTASPLPMALQSAAAVLFAAAGVFRLLEGNRLLADWREAAAAAYAPPPVTTPLAVLLSGLLCFPAALALLAMAGDVRRNQLTKKTCLLACFPAFAGLVWVFSIHLSNGVNPILMDYGFLLAAACLLTLGQYYTAAALFDHVCPRRMLFCGLSGVVLGLTALADLLREPGALLLVLALSLSALGWALAAAPNVCAAPTSPAESSEI